MWLVTTTELSLMHILIFATSIIHKVNLNMQNLSVRIKIQCAKFCVRIYKEISKSTATIQREKSKAQTLFKCFHYWSNKKYSQLLVLIMKFKLYAYNQAVKRIVSTEKLTLLYLSKLKRLINYIQIPNLY